MPTPDPTVPTVYLVDDEPAVLSALSRLLRSHGWPVQPYGSARALLDALPGSAIGCAVMDLAMPEMDGMALQRALVERGSLLGVVFLTGHGDLGTGVRAMKSGAVDFLSKPLDESQLVAAVSAAVDRSVAAGALARQRADVLARVAMLTPREREVMQRVVTGALNKQIAADLGTVEKTIKVHRARVMEKMRARSLAELVRLADLAGLPNARGSVTL